MKRITRLWLTLRDEMLKYLEHLNYSKSSLLRYKWLFDKLEEFINERGEVEYSQKIGMVFAEAMQIELEKSTCKFVKTAIRRLDDFLTGNYNKTHQKHTNLKCPEIFKRQFQNYSEYMRLQGRRETTIKHHLYYCAEALTVFDTFGIKNLSYVKAQDIHAAFALSSSKSNWSGACRNFFKYLYKVDVTKNDMSIYIPSVRTPKPLPTVYSKEETDELLSVINRSTKVGKRNYAIVLLALRLGIRSGDIIALKLSNVDFQAKYIEFIQGKTCVPQRLELLPEIESALTSYLLYGRPDNICDNLFLRDHPPFEQLTTGAINSLLTRLFNAAGINIEKKKHGPHSLRMTLASELVSEGIPYMVVGKILGHEDPNSAKSYIKFDIEMLRACALEVPPPSGMLAEKLNFFERRYV